MTGAVLYDTACIQGDWLYAPRGICVTGHVTQVITILVDGKLAIQ